MDKIDKNTIAVVFGAVSRETAILRFVARGCGYPVYQALHGGRDVDHNNAYKADATHPPLPPNCEIWRIECDGPVFKDIPADRLPVLVTVSTAANGRLNIVFKTATLLTLDLPPQWPSPAD